MPKSMAIENEQRRAAEEGQHGQGHQAGDAGDQGPRQGLVDRQVDQLAQRHALVLAQVLANPVEHHHGVVHRVADDGQEGRDLGQRELEPGDCEQAEGQDDVVEQGRTAPRPNGQAEPEPDVDIIRRIARPSARTVLEQLAGHLGADRLLA